VRGFVTFLGQLMHHPSALVGLIITATLAIVALAAPLIAPHDPIRQNLGMALRPPSPAHPLGTDEFGRDIASRILYGAAISLEVGALVVLLSGTIGVLLGLLAGFYERWVDQVISRSIEVLLAFPGLLLTIAAVTVLGPSLLNALLAVAFANIPRYARITRGAVLAQKRRDYVDAARAIGARDQRLMFVHILPNVAAPVVVVASLGVASAILTTSSLSFLGLGAQPPDPEWGAMLATGRTYMRRAWWLTLFPGLAIMVTVLAINLFGDGLRDILDPKGQRGSNI
jgi:ABC-type dipeptide/oligopeptide/nickel transport system permease subunit